MSGRCRNRRPERQRGALSWGADRPRISQVPDAEGQVWFELNPRDGFYIPAGFDHQYFNMTGEKVELAFGVAPEF